MSYDMPKGNHKLLNTHTYDYKIKDISKDFRSKIKYSVEEKIKYINEIEKEWKSISVMYRKTFLSNISLIKSGINKPENYDSTNDLYAEDLLAYIGEFYSKQDEKDKKDIFPDIALQIIDMSSGLCPQGRVIRLWQLVSSYI